MIEKENIFDTHVIAMAAGGLGAGCGGSWGRASGPGATGRFKSDISH